MAGLVCGIARWIFPLLALLGMGATAALGCESGPARRVVDQLINVRFEAAQAELADWHKLAPNDPMLALYMQVASWAKVEATWDKKRRQELAKQVSQQAETVAKQVEVALAADPGNHRLQLVAGLSEALAGKAALTAGDWFRAYHFGRSGRDRLRRLLDEDTAESDAYYILGLYEYYTGSVPSYLHWLTTMLDLSGDAPLGIRYLEKAVRSAPTLAPEAARTLLGQVIWRSGDHCRYWPLAQQARARYPNNPQFAIAVAHLAAQCGHAAEGIDDLTRARRDFRDEPRLTPFFDFLEIALREERGDIAWFKAHRQQQQKTDVDARWQLGFARAEDVAGDRQQATQRYAALADNADAAAPLRDAARQGLKQPYRPPAAVAGDPSLRLSECSPTLGQSAQTEMQTKPPL